MGDVLDVFTTALRHAGSQVAAASAAAASGNAALTAVSSAISGAALGGSIAGAASEFATTLAARCAKLTTTTTGQGSTIAQSAQVYLAADNSSTNDFQRIGVLSGHPAI